MASDEFRVTNELVFKQRVRHGLCGLPLADDTPVNSAYHSTLDTRHSTLARGFTLIEVVLVAIVLAILLTATVPRFQQAAQRLHTEQTAVDLMQLLRYAHELTVAQGEAIAWVWDSDTRQARLARVADVGRQWLTEPQARSRAIDDEISIEGTQDVDAVTFFPDGTSEPATLHVASGRNAYTLTVDAATSQVALSAGPAP